MTREPLPAHEIAESIGHPARGTAIVGVVDLDTSGDESDVFLSDLLETLQDAWASIPVEFRDSAVVRFRAYGDYASMSADVIYKRPETDSELADRRRWLSSLDRESEENDRHEFARLKAKYEPSK